MRQKYVWIFSVLFIFGLTITFNSMQAFGKGKTPPATAKTSIPQIKLTAPKAPDLQNYLGVQQDSEFNLTQIPTKMILIEILNTFCPDCQKSAPQMNRVYNIIENDADLKPDIKLIGIAAGNDAFQIEPFVKEFKIKYPVFPDPDNKIHELLGGAGPPGVILADIHGKVLFVHEGLLGDIDFLLEKIRESHKQL
jgi:thiol-disulfide isomerase/thioredoxin